MLFKPEMCEAILKGKKTQTRRLVKENDCLLMWPMACIFRNNRLLWRVAQTYAVQPGRGKKGIARIGVIGIRRERLQDITTGNIIAEGISTTLREHDATVHLLEQFEDLWDSIHPKGKRWEDNPEVWVLEFELVEGNDDG